MAMALISLQQLGLLWFCDGCWEQERIALLKLKASFSFPPLSWVEGSDCCGWELVECNNITGRVISLNLTHRRDDWNLGKWYLNAADFLVFEDLKILNLSSNSIHCCGQNQVQGFETISSNWSNLEILDLGGNNFTNNILSSLTGFSSLNVLLLNNNGLEGTINVRDINNLFGLKELNLNENKIEHLQVFEGTNETQPWWPSTLEVLELSYNTLNNDVLSSMILSKFPSLKSLDLKGNLLQGSVDIISGWSNLKYLEELHLRHNNFSGTIPQSFGNMTSLRVLDISRNKFIGNIGTALASFTSLEYLCFSYNQFEVPISFASFANHSNLQFIYGVENKVIPDPNPTLFHPKFQLQVFSLSSTIKTNTTLSFPNFFLYQYNLTRVHFTNCKFQAEIPTWLLENNTNLMYFKLKSCSFSGQIQLPLHPKPNLLQFDVSYNTIRGRIPSNISLIFPNLQQVVMSSNELVGSIPGSFGQMNSLTRLELAYNYLSGEIPENISASSSPLGLLKLSHNNLKGKLFPTVSTLTSLAYLSLDGNGFEGSIPISLSNSSLLDLDISQNQLVGRLPLWIGNLSNLQVVSMSENHIEGLIPTEFCKLENLVYLDMSVNNLSGFFPPCPNMISLKYLHLNENKFSGVLSRDGRVFSSNSSLVSLDLGDNDMHGRIPDWIGNLAALNILVLRGNHFMGRIPNQLCLMTGLTIIDLSYNSLSGPIPSCLSNITFKTIEQQVGGMDNFTRGLRIRGHDSRGLNSLIYVQEQVDFTTKMLEHRFYGNVLALLIGIDLSHNELQGDIPPELGNLTEVHSLNLSHNYLTGQIPVSFSNLRQIESLDLSFNKLNGRIPAQLSQLYYLAAFSVAHNNLSGPALDSKAVLYINPHWRRAWFYFIEFVINSCYYFFVDNFS
ncbi:putative Leucine-rich receptor-like kinase family protein [Quillaja saponaria]|uniref:Leucine-rich receptor-like kinase family protein n=1 Tax=Quillaja saponaria TaxID=32244 RepID=A0AAD7PKB5_QUISA|nr:putative Leucine-rich receptor-like kinase family protein [Quillaja saponaria]